MLSHFHLGQGNTCLTPQRIIIVHVLLQDRVMFTFSLSKQSSIISSSIRIEPHFPFAASRNKFAFSPLGSSYSLLSQSSLLSRSSLGQATLKLPFEGKLVCILSTRIELSLLAPLSRQNSMLSRSPQGWAHFPNPMRATYYAALLQDWATFFYCLPRLLCYFALLQITPYSPSYSGEANLLRDLGDFPCSTRSRFIHPYRIIWMNNLPSLAIQLNYTDNFLQIRITRIKILSSLC